MKFATVAIYLVLVVSAGNCILSSPVPEGTGTNETISPGRNLSQGKVWVQHNGETTTLTDMGGIALKMLEALTSDSDGSEVDLAGLTQLVTSVSRSSVFVDNPEVMRDYDLNTRLTDLEQKMQEELLRMKQQNEKLQRAFGLNSIGPDFVVFSAYLSEDQDVVAGSVVKFSQTVLNKGSTYDPAFGYYTCPQSGYYHVSLSYRRTNIGSHQSSFGLILKTGSQATSLQLHDYFRDVSEGYASKTRYSNTISGSHVVYCRREERMTVEATAPGTLMATAKGSLMWSGSGTLMGNNAERYTNIVLYLLKAGDP